MKILRQLRWRIIGSHMVVVLTGVAILLLTSQMIIITLSPNTIQPSLINLDQAPDNATIEQTMEMLRSTFRNTIFFALVVAAIGAIIAGLLTSILLARGILHPLQQIVQSSQRIAAGHYDERITLPDSTELGLVATNFNQMAESLAQIEAQRITLIGNVSHELRTPLTGIEGYLEGLIDGVLPNDSETFAQMYHEVRRLRRLVNDLQDLSKVEAGQVSLRLQDFDLIPIIERVVAQLHPQATVQDQTLRADLPPTLAVHADPDRTAQVLLNLIGNAIRYTPENGQINIKIHPLQNDVELRVQDTGIGIPADALPYIFERFYRVDSSRARSSGGSGIGLTISRRLAWAMDGELTAISAGLDQGSIFTFILPLAGDEIL